MRKICWYLITWLFFFSTLQLLTILMLLNVSFPAILTKTPRTQIQTGFWVLGGHTETSNVPPFVSSKSQLNQCCEATRWLTSLCNALLPPLQRGYSREQAVAATVCGNSEGRCVHPSKSFTRTQELSYKLKVMLHVNTSSTYFCCRMRGVAPVRVSGCTDGYLAASPSTSTRVLKTQRRTERWLNSIRISPPLTTT